MCNFKIFLACVVLIKFRNDVRTQQVDSVREKRHSWTMLGQVRFDEQYSGFLFRFAFKIEILTAILRVTKLILLLGGGV